MKIFRRLLILDFRRAILSWQLYMAIGIIMFGALVTYNRNLLVRNLDQLYTVGTINIFIYSNIVANNIINLLAPVVAGLVFSTIIIDDIKTGFYSTLALKVTPIKYIKSKVVSSIIYGGGVFVISYVLFFLIAVIYDPSASVRTEFYCYGLFGLIYDKSMLLYCLAYIGYSFVFGAIFSLVSFGTAMVTKNKYLALGLPFFIYYISEYVMSLFPPKVSEILHYFIPHLTFDTIAYTPIHYVLQLSFSAVVSIALIYRGTKSLIEEGRL